MFVLQVVAVLLATGLSHTQPETELVVWNIFILTTHVLNTYTD